MNKMKRGIPVKKRNPQKHLPRVAPKRTGKAGIRPVEPETETAVAEQLVVNVATDEETPNEAVGKFVDAVADTREGRKTRKKKAPEQLQDPDAPTGRGRQTELPGMEDKHIEELEEIAEKYAEVRDRRVSLSRTEVDLKGQLLQCMKRHDKVLYRVAEMEIKIVSTEETVKVRILKDDE
jgi:hypothetical protein